MISTEKGVRFQEAQTCHSPYSTFACTQFMKRFHIMTFNIKAPNYVTVILDITE